MYDIKTASEARKYTDIRVKEKRAQQIHCISANIDEAVELGMYKVGPYPPNHLYSETISMLNSLGYTLEVDSEGRNYISWR